MTATASDNVNLGDLEFWLGDPLPTLADLRRQNPVVWEPESGCWIVLRHADVAHAMRTPSIFSSAYGIHRKSPRASAIDDYLLGSLIVSDAPEHTFLHKLVMPGFTPRTVLALEPRVRAMTVELLDTITDDRSYDVVHDLAADVPTSIICELLGIPQADQSRIAALIEDCGGGFDNYDPTRSQKAPGLVYEYLNQLFEGRGDKEYDDLIALISRPGPDGRRLTRHEINQFCFLLLIGGTDNTRASIASGVECFAQNLDQLARLREDPGLMPTAVEEIIRYGSVASITARTVLEPTELSGVPIGAGQMVLLVIPSANFDETVFGPDVTSFRIDRKHNPHLGWGFAAHSCVGAPLARLTIRVFFDELLKRFSSWEVGPPTRVAGFEHFNGYDRLPATFTR